MKHEKMMLGALAVLLACAGVFLLVACKGEVPEELPDKAVVTWTVLERTDTACRVRFVNGTGSDLSFGEAFALSRLAGDGSMAPLPFDTEPEVKDIAWVLPEGGSVEKTYSWEGLYDTFPAGKLALTVWFYGEDGEHKTVVELPEAEPGADKPTATPYPEWDPTDGPSSVTPSPAADAPVVTENTTGKPTATPYPVMCYTPVPVTAPPTQTPGGDAPIVMPEDIL